MYCCPPMYVRTCGAISSRCSCCIGDVWSSLSRQPPINDLTSSRHGQHPATSSSSNSSRGYRETSHHINDLATSRHGQPPATFFSPSSPSFVPTKSRTPLPYCTPKISLSEPSLLDPFQTGRTVPSLQQKKCRSACLTIVNTICIRPSSIN